jgi:ankyrin repeat protein
MRNSEIFMICIYLSSDVVKYLLKWKNAPEAVNTPNNAGRTCLHIAAIVNNLPLCKLLLDNGADRNSVMMHKVPLYIT